MHFKESEELIEHIQFNHPVGRLNIGTLIKRDAISLFSESGISESKMVSNLEKKENGEVELYNCHAVLKGGLSRI